MGKDLSSELLTGSSVLQVHNGKMVRIVDVVLLKISKEDGSMLVEVSETLNGATQTLNRLPGVKRRSDENHFLAAQRALTKVLKVDENCVSISCDGILFLEQESQSSNYCGLPTIYNKRYINGTPLTIPSL